MEDQRDQLLNDTASTRGSRPRPAQGERRAISGYYPQYRVSASIVLRALRAARLEWIRIADPDAGRVDDLQLGTQNRLDAYQIKWSRFPGPFTFHNLTIGNSSRASIFYDLARGWIELNKAYPDKRVVVHFLTNEYPSSSTGAHLPLGSPPPTQKHFAAFLAQAWRPIHDAPLNAGDRVPDEWLTTWNALREESGLHESEFAAFVRDCEFEFGHQLPGAGSPSDDPDQRIVATDIDHIAQSLFQSVADPIQMVELPRAALLQRLGWSQRFDLKNLHEFPVDEDLYQPIHATVEELRAALEKVNGGYIAVLGTPGSGKSTLLTKTLREVSDRVVAYYAYVPDSHYPNSLRGESVNFLHDVVHQLDSEGFRVGDSPSNLERDQLLQRLHDQLGKLGDDWRGNGRKTIILIDGLDHIEREQNPQRPLLSDLPNPDEVPDGVYFVLGAQTDAPFPHRVQAAVQDSSRKIVVQPLRREQVLRMVEAANPSLDFTTSQREIIHELSAGHPLATAYLANRIRLCQSVDELLRELHQSENFDGDILAGYHTHWKQVDNDQALQRLLGLLARIRGEINLSWVRTWAERDVVDRLGNRFAHFFRIETADKWYFFHDSFRLFLIHKTAEFPPGTHSLDRHREFHSELAEICATDQGESRWSWEQIHHLACADQDDKVLPLATQTYFRRQFFALRPVEAIRADLLISLRCAANVKDPLALVRLILAASEVEQREYNVGRSELVLLLIELNEHELASSHIRTGNRLCVDRSTALKAAQLFMRGGNEQEAKLVFDIAEPLDLLRKPISTFSQGDDDTFEVLSQWALAAIVLRDIEAVIRLIQQLSCEPDPTMDVDPHTLSLSLRFSLLYDTGTALLDEERWTELSKVLDAFDLNSKSGILNKFWLHDRICNSRKDARDNSRAIRHAEAMFELGTKSLRPKELIALAEIAFRVLGDNERARDLIEGLEQPEIQVELLFLDDKLAPFDDGFRLNRLLYALGDRRSPSEIVRRTNDPRRENEEVMDLALCNVARIWARGWVNEPIIGAAIDIHVTSLLRLFSSGGNETLGYTNRITLASRSTAFYGLLIDAVARHGLDALKSLWNLFSSEWDDPEASLHWTPERRRGVILAFVRNRFPNSCAIEKLKGLAPFAPDDGDASERASACLSQASAWLEVGGHAQARRFLDMALSQGFGVGYRKDYQLNRWIKWLGKVNEVEPEQAPARISKFACAIVDVKRFSEGPAAYSASIELLRVAFRWNPSQAILLLQWFLDEGLVVYDEGISALLKEALEQSDPPLHTILRVVSEVVLPIDTRPEPELISSLIKRLERSVPQHDVIQIVKTLISKVHLYAMPSVRIEWLRGVDQGVEDLGISSQEVGLSREDLKSEPDGMGDWNTLRLNNVEAPLRSWEVNNQVSSIPDIQQLLMRETESSLFDWKPVVLRVVQCADDEFELRNLAEQFKTRRFSSHILTLISARLNQLGDKVWAWRIALDALRASSPFGWNTGYDGGTKLSGFEVLKKIDGDLAIDLTYDSLVRDLEDNLGLVTHLNASLGEILELLESPVSITDIWSEIEEYSESLLGTRSYPMHPLDLSNSTAQGTPQSAIVKLMGSELAHPCPALSRAAQRVLGRLLLEKISDAYRLLAEFLDSSEDYQERILTLLDAVSLIDPGAVTELRSRIEKLATSPNWSIRSMSRSISKNCGWNSPVVSAGLATLPSIYDLILPSRPTTVPTEFEQLRSEIPIPDSNEPGTVVVPFNTELKLLAEIANVSEENACRRVMEIMLALDPSDVVLSSLPERQLRESLKSAGLELPFLRPRPSLARRAMFHAVAELDDAGRLPGDLKELLVRRLRTYDPKMVLAEPVLRPAQINPMSAFNIHVDLRDWVESAETALIHTHWMPDDMRTVLAEETSLERRGVYGSASEVRSSVVAPRGWAALGSEPDAEKPFAMTKNALISEYADLNTDSVGSAIVIRNDAYAYDSMGAEWLAFNPQLARQLGWTFADDGMFKWVDFQGCTMVESLWWIDALVASRSRESATGDAGEGWIVLASTSALEVLRQVLGALSKTSVVVRRSSENGENWADHAISNRPI